MKRSADKVNRRRFLKSTVFISTGASAIPEIVSSGNCTKTVSRAIAFSSEVHSVVFTNPAIPGTAGAIDNHLELVIHLIDSTSKGDIIHIVSSHFSSASVADAMISAAKRDVKVNIILKESSGNSTIKNRLIAASSANINLTYKRGCYGNSIHTKLFLFSKAAINGQETHNVIVAGSGNLTNANQQNNMFVINDEKLYVELRAYWTSMKAKAHSDGSVDLANVDFFSASNKIKAYLFPRSSDLILNILDNINFTPNRAPTLKIAMARWTSGARGKNIAVKIWEVVSKGCYAEIVIRDDHFGEDDGVANEVITLLRLGVSIFPHRLKVYSGSVEGEIDDVHSKYILISANYASGSEWEQNVWSGSENFTTAALKSNDEIVFKFRDAELYKIYEDNFNKLKSYCDDLAPYW